MIVIPEESILEYFCVNFVDPFRMTDVEESWAFSNAKLFYDGDCFEKAKLCRFHL